MQRVLLLLVLACAVCRADTIILTDGTTYEGDIVSEDPTTVIIKCRFGKITIARNDIKKIEKKESASVVYQKKIEALEAGDKHRDVGSWVALAKEARKDGAPDEMHKCWERVQFLDPTTPKPKPRWARTSRQLPLPTKGPRRRLPQVRTPPSPTARWTSQWWLSRSA
jgi:hypothetical protein